MKSGVSVTPWLEMPHGNGSSLNDFSTYFSMRIFVALVQRSDAIS
jgi:hypothetical protein